MKKISVEVPEALDRQVRVLAAQLDLNRSKLARLALQEKVERLTADAPRPSSGYVVGRLEEEVAEPPQASNALPPEPTKAA